MRSIGITTLRAAVVCALAASGCGSSSDTTAGTTKAATATTTGLGGAGQGGAGQGGGAGGASHGGAGQGGGAGGATQDIAPSIVSSSDATFMEAETSVAAGPNGFVVVAYIAVEMTGASSNGYRFSKDGGQTWGSAMLLDSPNGRVSSDPVVTFDTQGRAWMSWVGYYLGQSGATDMHVYVASAPAGSTTFGEPVEVSDPAAGTTLDKPWIAVTSKGTLVVTYAETATGSIYMARSADGKTWTRSTIEDGAAHTSFGNLLYPCPSDSGRLYVAFIHVSGMGGGVRLRWSDDDGVTWPIANKTDVVGANEQAAFDDPTCVAHGNDVWVSYGVSQDPFSEQQSAKLSGVRVAHSGNGGHLVDRRSNADDQSAATYSMHPQLTREEGGALDLVYYAGNQAADPSGSFRRVRSTDGGATWAPSEIVKEPIVFVQSRADQRWLGDYTGIAWRDGALYTSFADNAGAQSHVAFARTKLP